jgi:Putative beta barrel porin-7 (BBP7)
MKTNLKRLMLASFLSAAGGFVAHADQLNQGKIGDVAGYGEEAYFAEDAAYSEDYESQPSASRSAMHATKQVAHEVQYASPAYVPVSASHLQQSSCLDGSRLRGGNSSSCDSIPCETVGGDCGCGDSCGGDSCGGCNSCGCDQLVTSLTSAASGNCWMSAEALLWFIEPRDVPPLVVTNSAGNDPDLSDANAQVAFGNEIDSSIAAGFRVDAGVFLADNIGVGGRYWKLFDGDESYNSGDVVGADGSVGRSFFNTLAGTEDALKVAFSDGVGGDTDFQGSIDVNSSIDLWAAEGYGRIRLSGAETHTVDLIGGYTHLELEEGLRIFSRHVNVEASAGQPVGTVRTYLDELELENHFDGGQVGFETSVSRGRWLMRTLTKVHLGNMKQTARANGDSTRTTPTPTSSTTDSGVFAIDNQGEFSQDEFAFMPEANVKIAYRFCSNVSMSVGYSFLYMDDVLTSGSVINRNVDPSRLNTNGVAAPINSLKTDSLFVHGLDLGVILDF